MATSAPVTWQGRQVVHPDHVVDLEAAAGAAEFRDKLPRHLAEERAYQGYKKERALDAAAHHLVGIRAAHAAGDDESAKAHGQAYADALGVAGHEPVAEPPREVLDRIATARPALYKFKGHAADALWAPPPEPPA